MKQVQLISLNLVNFKAHKELNVDFKQETTISGDNGTGKSTIFDSFLWTLFGKDQFNRKDFEIIPTINNQRLDRIDSEATALINIDGVDTTFKRVLHQKWVRRRGTSEEVFDGCETLYYINDVPKKAGEYKAFVDTIVEESVFKLITNPTAFLSLHWTKQREFLFNIAGTVSDKEIANSNPIFAALLDLLNGKSLVDFKKELSARKKKLKDDLEDIQPKINQTTKLMPEQKDFDLIEAEINAADKLIEAIDLQISDKSAAIRGQYEEIQEKQKQINDLKTKQNEVVHSVFVKENQEVFEGNQKRTEVQQKMSSVSRNLKAEEDSIKEEQSKLGSIKLNLETKNDAVIKLRAEWTTESAKELTFDDNDFHCPTCKRDFESGDVEAKKTEMLTNFKADKAEKLANINTKGLQLKADIEALNTKILTISKVILDYNLLYENSQNEFADLTESLKSLKELPSLDKSMITASEIPEWQELDKQIKAIEATITEVVPVDNAELNIQKAELIAKRDQLKKELSEKDLIAKYQKEVKDLEKQGSDLAQQIADAEKQEFTIDDFNRIKIEECDRRVNELFQIVKFQLFDKTNDGNEFEACIATNKNGVPISATNTAEKINAGIDIINLLSKFYNVSAPIFCDGAESNNNYLHTVSQSIFLRVTHEKELTIK